jgi:hypothetical protein
MLNMSMNINNEITKHEIQFDNIIDLDWIIISFSIYLDAFRVETIGGIILWGHFSGKS